METDLSIIIPMKNLGVSIKEVLKVVDDCAKGINVEYILLDINSRDNTMIKALEGVELLGLNGRVIQCGSSPYGAVLNSGLRNAQGLYSTFIFPRQMYKNFIPSYLKTAKENMADVVFGKMPDTIFGKSLNFSSVKISGQEMFKAVISGYTSLDLGTMMFKTFYIHSRKVYFDDESSVGYAEEYIYKSLLLADKICQCDCVVERDDSVEVPKSPSAGDDFACFGKIESMLRTDELLEYCSVDESLKEKFEKEKIPDMVLDCVDSLIKRGYEIKTIKKALKIKGYDKLLVVSPKTNKNIKRAVFNFNYMPWMYKPR